MWVLLGFISWRLLYVKSIIIHVRALFFNDAYNTPRTQLRTLLRLQPPLLYLLATGLLIILMLPPPACVDVCKCVHTTSGYHPACFSDYGCIFVCTHGCGCTRAHACVGLPVYECVCVCACMRLCTIHMYIAGQIRNLFVWLYCWCLHACVCLCVGLCMGITHTHLRQSICVLHLYWWY